MKNRYRVFVNCNEDVFELCQLVTDRQTDSIDSMTDRQRQTDRQTDREKSDISICRQKDRQTRPLLSSKPGALR